MSREPTSSADDDVITTLADLDDFVTSPSQKNSNLPNSDVFNTATSSDALSEKGGTGPDHRRKKRTLPSSLSPDGGVKRSKYGYYGGYDHYDDDLDDLDAFKDTGNRSHRKRDHRDWKRKAKVKTKASRPEEKTYGSHEKNRNVHVKCPNDRIRGRGGIGNNKRQQNDSIQPPPPPRVPQPQVKLSKDQERVIELVISGKNVFITGTAGTGKSFVLSMLLGMLKAKGKNVFLTASVGIAAVNISGTTVHSFAGIGTGEDPIDKILERITRNRRAQKNWISCDVLVIDEISMISASLFEKLDIVGRRFRYRSDKPFGGVQLVLVGDFLQLPPVFKQGNLDTRFCFESNVWKEACLQSVELKEVFRQSEINFLNILNKVRLGNPDSSVMGFLMETKKTKFPEGDGISATRMYCFNRDVDYENAKRLNELPGEVQRFDAHDWGSSDYMKGLLDRSCITPKVLNVKRGAQVMLTRNLDLNAGLCNGSQGIIVGFGGDSVDDSHENNGNDTTNSNINADYDSGSVVCRLMAGTSDDERDSTKNNKKAASFNRRGDPIVRFASGEHRSIGTETFELTLGEQVQARRIQIPLKLCWAMTIHKGMTLDRVEVDLGGVFASGQAYVALSRVKEKEGLKVKSFQPGCVYANTKAIEFYKRTFGATALSSSVVAVQFQQQQKMQEKRMMPESISSSSTRAATTTPKSQKPALTRTISPDTRDTAQMLADLGAYDDDDDEDTGNGIVTLSSTPPPPPPPPPPQRVQSGGVLGLSSHSPRVLVDSGVHVNSAQRGNYDGVEEISCPSRSISCPGEIIVIEDSQPEVEEIVDQVDVDESTPAQSLVVELTSEEEEEEEDNDGDNVIEDDNDDEIESIGSISADDEDISRFMGAMRSPGILKRVLSGGNLSRNSRIDESNNNDIDDHNDHDNDDNDDIEEADFPYE